MRRLIRSCAALAGDRRGTSVVEMGFLAPVLGMLVMGVIDLGQGLSERYTLQQSVNRSIELLHANPPEGDATSNDVDYSYLVAQAAEAADVPTSQVTLTRWLQCAGIKAASYTGTCASGQDTARYLELRIDKDFDANFFLGTMPMVATGAIRIQ